MMELFYGITEIIANFMESLVGYQFSCLILNKNEKSRLLYILAVVQAIVLYLLQRQAVFSNYTLFLALLAQAVCISIFFKMKFSVTLATSATYIVNVVALTELSSLVVLGVLSRQEFIGRVIVSGQSVTRSIYILTIKLVQVVVYLVAKYSLQGTTQGRYLTGGVPPVRFSM